MIRPCKYLWRCLPIILLLGPVPLAQSGDLSGSDNRYLQIVRTYADNVLQYGRDVYGPKHTPLFVDGINVDTHEPPVWPARKDYAKIWRMPDQWVLSNLASQQNLFRVLTSLTLLTGDPHYKQAAVDATRYGFDHLQHETGLMFWGGHAAWDAGHEQPVGEATSREVAGKHELKHHYPFYELMWEIDPKATRKCIEAFWANHILRWDILDFNRHGYFEPIPAWIWESQYVGGPVPFTGQGLTFFNAGSDLFYSAAMLTKFSGDPRPLVWGKRLAKRFVDVRHPETGLGADNFSQYKTHRIQKAFEKKFGDRVTEVTITSLYGNRYSLAAIGQMKLYEQLGEPARDFLQWAIQDLAAYAIHAYDPSDNTFWATLIDGTRMRPEDGLPRGYVSPRSFRKRSASPQHLWAFALAYKLSKDPLMWDMVRQIAAGLGLGQFGATPAGKPIPDMQTTCADDKAVLALLELHQAIGDPSYLALACKVADNLIQHEFHKGFFVDSPDHLFAKFNNPAPLALLYLHAALSDATVELPLYPGSRSYFTCIAEDKGRTNAQGVIYAKLRK